MEQLFGRPMPQWSDRRAVAEFAASGAEILGDDPVTARRTAGRIWDRTPSEDPAVHMANQMGMVFSRLDCSGRRDPFFPVGNAEACARDIPGAQLLILEDAATVIPEAAADEVATAMLALSGPS